MENAELVRAKEVAGVEQSAKPVALLEKWKLHVKINIFTIR